MIAIQNAKVLKLPGQDAIENELRRTSVEMAKCLETCDMQTMLEITNRMEARDLVCVHTKWLFDVIGKLVDALHGVTLQERKTEKKFERAKVLIADLKAIREALAAVEESHNWSF